MAFPKIEMFHDIDREVSYSSRALGYPARVMILRILSKAEVLAAHEIAKRLPITEGAVTEHLRRLRLAGLVRVHVDRLINYYEIDHEGLRRHFELLSGFAEDLEVGSV